MKRSVNLACVLGILALQSCYSSSGKRPLNYGHNATIATADSIVKVHTLKPVSEYNGIKIDTLYDETTLFVNRVDDEKGLAYASFYQFDGASTTELAVVVPYNCMRWDSDSKTHMLLLKEFRLALASDSLSHMFVQNRTLTGHKYTKVDARM